MRKILQDKINMNDINKICIMTQGKENDHRKEELYQLGCPVLCSNINSLV